MALTVTDLDRSRPWYQDLFGAEPLSMRTRARSTTWFGFWVARRWSAFTTFLIRTALSRSTNVGPVSTTLRLPVRTAANSSNEESKLKELRSKMAASSTLLMGQAFIP